MRMASPLTLCAIYIAAVLAAASGVGPTMTPWLLVGLSAALGWCYSTVARGRKLTALTIVGVVTILLPFAALIALAWPLYRSPSDFAASLWREFREQGLSGLVLLAPLLVASIVVSFARPTRSC
jgi:hypothetical protein